MIQAQPGISGTSITHPTDYRTFKPYRYRGNKRHGCGTYAGYYRHKRRKTEPCTPCKTAYTYHSKLKKRRTLQKQRTGIYCEAPDPCSARGYKWHKNRRETPCPECTRYHAKENQKC